MATIFMCLVYLVYLQPFYQKFADELTSEEKLEIAKYQTIYSALRGKAGLKNFGESLKEAAKKAQDALEENKD